MKVDHLPILCVWYKSFDYTKYGNGIHIFLKQKR